jgi:acyl-CoA thioesterase
MTSPHPDPTVKPPVLKTPFLKDLGVEFLDSEVGESRCALNVESRHANAWHSAHGGVVMTLLDVCMGRAATSADAGSIGGVTIEMKTSFIAPAGGPGSRIFGHGKVIHRGSSLVFCEAEIHTADGKVVAKATGTFKTRRRVRDPAAE